MSYLRAAFHAFWRFLIEILFPAFCMGCGIEGCFLCATCLKQALKQDYQVCPACCKTRTDGSLCDLCANGPVKQDYFLDGVTAIAAYEEKSLLARAIHSLKYEFVEDLAEPLAGLVAEKLKNPQWGDFVICPVPLHNKRLKWRGFNQSELLAKLAVRAAALHGGALALTPGNLLERTTFFRPQMELKKEERAKNVAGAFRCLGTPPPKVMLIDDVATTLATLNACAKTMKDAGTKEVCAIVLARAY
jgi:ComF family protein